MARSGEKAALEAPADNVRRCVRCFAAVSAEARFCPDCGASLDSGDPRASDAAVQQELANANLSRIRKDYKAAEEQCLAILRRFPNSVSANVLMGDIHYERGDFHQAAEWYELALDLDPRSVPTQQKLVDARRLSDPDALPPGFETAIAGPRTRLPSWAWASILGFVLLLAAAAIWPKGPAAKPAVIRTQVVAPRQDPPPVQDEPSREERPVQLAAVEEDQKFLERLSTLDGVGSSLLGAQYDPRTRTALITFLLPEEGAKELAASIGRALLEADAEVARVTLRGVRDGRSAFFADLTREKLPPPGVANNPDEMLTDVYPPVSQGDAPP